MKEFFHVFVFFRGMLEQEFRCAAVAFPRTPGPHLQIEIGGIKFECDLFVQFVEDGLTEHDDVSPEEK
jgi:hypothetical protein